MEAGGGTIAVPDLATGYDWRIGRIQFLRCRIIDRALGDH
jgi:hypothetical protein